MGYNISPYYGAVAVWWMEKGIPFIYFLDSRSTNPLYADIVMSKCPGGTSNTSPQEAVYRELREETGLSIRKGSKLIPIHHEVVCGPHTKQGFLIHRDECKGSLRKVWKKEEGSLLGRPYGISLNAAIAKVHATERNQFHPIFLRKVKRKIAKMQKASKKAQPIHVRGNFKSAAA